MMTSSDQRRMTCWQSVPRSDSRIPISRDRHELLLLPPVAFDEHIDTPRQAVRNVQVEARPDKGMRRRRRDVLREAANTIEGIASRGIQPERVLIDTGPAEGGYRIHANLKKRRCPRCKCVHYSSWAHDFCIACYACDIEERKLGGKLTVDEERQLMRDVGLADD